MLGIILNPADIEGKLSRPFRPVVVVEIIWSVEVCPDQEDAWMVRQRQLVSGDPSTEVAGETIGPERVREPGKEHEPAAIARDAVISSHSHAIHRFNQESVIGGGFGEEEDVDFASGQLPQGLVKAGSQGSADVPEQEGDGRGQEEQSRKGSCRKGRGTLGRESSRRPRGEPDLRADRDIDFRQSFKKQADRRTVIPHRLDRQDPGLIIPVNPS